MASTPQLAALPPALKVLVVDDRPDAADTLADLLRGLGADVRTCYAGAQAKETAMTWFPDAAVLDLKMPGMGGLELAHHLRELRPRPVLVALTGADDELTREQAAAVGFDLFLTKAADLSDLSALLSRLATVPRAGG